MTDFQLVVAWTGVVLIVLIGVTGWLFWYTHGGREKW
jgi:cytochrome b subunit of formate dehydrogenase